MSASLFDSSRPTGPRTVRSTGALSASKRQDNMENCPDVKTFGATHKYPYKRSAGLPVSRSWPLALASSDAGESIAVNEAKIGSWQQYRSPAHSASGSSSSVKTCSDSSGSSYCAGSDSAPSPWNLGSNLSSPRFEDTERLEPPSPWEQLTPDTSFMNSTNADSASHGRTPPSFQRPISYAGYNHDESLSTAAAAAAAAAVAYPSAGLLPAATVRASSLNAAGAPVVPLDPSDPGQPSFAGKPRRVPLAEIPLWYADARGEYLRRVRQGSRSGLCNVMGLDQTTTQQHVLSTNTSHNIPASETFPTLAEMTSASSQSSGINVNDNMMLEMSSHTAVCDESVEHLFVLADEPRATASQSPPRKAKSKGQRRKGGLEKGGSTPLKKLCNSRSGR